jgi:hypothetical protein
MKFISGDNSPRNSSTYDIKISLTKSKLPRMIPIYLRTRIRQGDTSTIRIVLTILNLYRVLPYPGKVKLSTITDPFSGFISKEMTLFIPIFLSYLKLKPFEFKWNPFVIASSGAFTGIHSYDNKC